MAKKLWYRVCILALIMLALPGCGVIRDVGKGLTNSFKGFSIHFP